MSSEALVKWLKNADIYRALSRHSRSACVSF